MAEVTAVDKTDFQARVLENEKPVVVKFMATWCVPCKQLAPMLESIADAHDEIVIVELDIDANREIAQQYNVMGVPTMMVFQNGEVTKTVVGAKPKVVLERELLSGL